MKGYVNDLQLMTINVGYACHQGDWNWTNVRSPFARLYYVTDGEAWIVKHAVRSGDESVRIHLTPHHLYLIPPSIIIIYMCMKIQIPRHFILIIMIFQLK